MIKFNDKLANYYFYVFARILLNAKSRKTIFFVILQDNKIREKETNKKSTPSKSHNIYGHQ